MDITACPWGVLLKVISMTQDAFASSRETQMPYADHPTPLDRYAARVREAACQYRRDCVILSEASAYAKLKSEQQRAMRELVTGEYWRMIAVRDAPHREPIDVMTRHWSVSIDGGALVHLDLAQYAAAIERAKQEGRPARVMIEASPAIEVTLPARSKADNRPGRQGRLLDDAPARDARPD
jgi:hypothetical protein